MRTLQWPARLSNWKSEISTAVRKAEAGGLLETHVSFQALNPRGKSTDFHDVELGAQIGIGERPLVTYFLAIGGKDKTNTRRLLRKVHFDLQEGFDPHEPKPVLHLQVGGGISPSLARKYSQEDFEALHPNIEKPRIGCLPQSFAMLVHQALLEYHCTDEKLSAFVKSAGWLAVVAAAERTVLKPYFDHGDKWFASTAKRNDSLLSCFYGLGQL